MKTLNSIIVILLLLLSSCSETDLFDTTDCSNCFTSRPQYGSMRASITINENNQIVPLEIYQGDYNENNLIYRDTAYNTQYYIDLDTDQRYTFAAKYYSKGRIVIVVNSSRLRTQKDYSSCDNVCYKILGDNIDLKLKK